MNPTAPHVTLSFRGETLSAMGSGALWWAGAGLLCVSDLHLGKSERRARLGQLLPPYETRDTLARLDADLRATGAGTVVCLGDSFDDDAAAGALGEEDSLWIARMQAGRRWIWIAGNHDPGPLSVAGEHLAEHREGPLVFRHVAVPGEQGEISGHYHPKVSVMLGRGSVSRAAFLVDAERVLMPAYGTYTGGLRATDAALQALLGPDAIAVVTGPRPCMVPMPRRGPTGPRPGTARTGPPPRPGRGSCG